MVVPLGFRHSLFEVALDVLKRTKDINQPASIRDAFTSNRLRVVRPHQLQKGALP